MPVSTFSENKIYNVTAQNVISYFKYFISTTNKKSITEAKKNCLQMFISSTTPPNYKWIKYLPLCSVIKKIPLDKTLPHARLIEKFQCSGEKRIEAFQTKTRHGQQLFPTGKFSTTTKKKSQTTSQLRSSSHRNCYIGLFRLHILSKHYFTSTFGRRWHAEILEPHSYISFVTWTTDPSRKLSQMFCGWT